MGMPEHPLIPIAVGETRIAFPRCSVKAGGDPARNRHPDRSKLLIPGQPAGIHDVQFRINLPPIPNGQGSFFHQFTGRQIECLEQTHGVGEDRAAAVQPTESAVQALYGVGRVHDLTSSIGELEHWADAVPVVSPAVHTAGMLCLPRCSDRIQTGHRRLFVRGVINRLQVLGECFLSLSATYFSVLRTMCTIHR